jgi:hypothetical protein
VTPPSGGGNGRRDRGVVVYASVAALDEYRRLGGTRVLENAVAEAYRDGRVGKRWGRPAPAPHLAPIDRYVWLGGDLCAVVRTDGRTPAGSPRKRVLRVLKADHHERSPR